MSVMFKELWDDYVVKVLHEIKDDPIALEEQKRLFYAGAFAYICVMDRLGDLMEKDEKKAIVEMTNTKSHVMRFMVDRIKQDKLQLNIQMFGEGFDPFMNKHN